jgi:hypothetical protein
MSIQRWPSNNDPWAKGADLPFPRRFPPPWRLKELDPIPPMTAEQA